jgi:glycosyltransferase involved in cell wall biosynthesis
MACGIPCAVTDCGDSREIVGAAGKVVPTRAPAALANAVLELLRLTPDERRVLGDAGARRVRDRYELGVVARRFVQLYLEIRRTRSGASPGPEA